MEEPRHKFLRTTMGAIFIVGILLILALLYVYYFSPDNKPVDNNTNSTSTEDHTNIIGSDNASSTGAPAQNSSIIDNPAKTSSSTPGNTGTTDDATPKANFDVTNDTSSSSSYQQINGSNFDER